MKAAFLSNSFTNTKNKDFIRTLDSGFLRQEVSHHGKKLRYFGLPGENLLDLIAWKDFLAEITAVERGSRSEPYAKQNFLVSKALQLGFSNELTLLRGDVNQIILTDKDEVGTRVAYPFELINLDYGGSILYPDRKLVNAIEVLINRQRPTDFILLITANIREFDQEELVKTQKRIFQEILQYRPDIKDQLQAFFSVINEKEPILRQIIHLHFLVKCLGETNKYKTTCFPAIYYQGSKKTELIHYIIRLRYEEGVSTKVVSDQSLPDILNQGFKKVDDSKLLDVKPCSIDF